MKSWRIPSIRWTAIFPHAPSPGSASYCGRISWNSIASHEETEHRHHRTRLHGARAFQRLRPGQPFLRNRLRAAIESDLRPESGRPGEDGGHLGLGGDLDRLAQ